MVSSSMDLASELAPFSPSSELLSWVEKRVSGLLEQLDTRATEIHVYSTASWTAIPQQTGQ
jgi:hypothetical protein